MAGVGVPGGGPGVAPDLREPHRRDAAPCTGGSVIPAGVDVALFRPIDREDARRQLGWQVDARYSSFRAARA